MSGMPSGEEAGRRRFWDHGWLDWYQDKLGGYDQQLWEQNTEQRILSRLEHRPVKTAKRLNQHLVDLDLIRGSTFEKAKSSRRAPNLLLLGLARTLLLPLCLPWWRRHTAPSVAASALAVHLLLLSHVTLSLLLLLLLHLSPGASSMILSELAWPCAAFAALGALQSYVAATAKEAGEADVEGETDDESGSFADAAPAPPETMPAASTVEDVGGLRLRRQRHLQQQNPGTRDVPRPGLTIDKFLLPGPIERNDASSAAASAADAEARTIAGVVCQGISEEDSSSSDAAGSANRSNSQELLANSRDATLPDGGGGRNFDDSSASRDGVAADTADEGMYSDSQLSDIDRLPSVANSEASTESDVASSVLDEAEDEDPVTALLRDNQRGKSIYCFVWPGTFGGRKSPAKSAASARKMQLTMLDIGWCVIRAVEAAPSCAVRARSPLRVLLPSLLAAAVPLICYWWQRPADPSSSYQLLCGLQLALGVAARFGLHVAFYFVMCVADRTLWQRFLFAKHFCFLTSSRRARKYRVPHFRLNKPSNIKVWLGLRSYLRRRGPQRSLQAVTSLALCCFLASGCLLSYLPLNLSHGQLLANALFWDALLLFACTGYQLLRFLAVGTRVNRRFRCPPVLATEQLNLCLAMDAKPHRRPQLQLAQSMIKHTEDLLKSLEEPYRIGGFAVNPFVCNALRVVIVAALSEVLSKLLGFKVMLERMAVNPAG